MQKGTKGANESHVIFLGIFTILAKCARYLLKRRHCIYSIGLSAAKQLETFFEMLHKPTGKEC